MPLPPMMTLLLAFNMEFSELVYSPGDTTATMDGNVSKNLKWASITGDLNYIPVLLPD